MSRYSQFSPKMRRSRKLSCKKGGVDCRVSRRERDTPNTSRPLESSTPEYFRTDQGFPCVQTSNLQLDKFKHLNSEQEKNAPISKKILSMLIRGGPHYDSRPEAKQTIQSLPGAARPPKPNLKPTPPSI